MKTKRFIITVDDVNQMIETLCRKEQWVVIYRWFLGASFFPISLVFMFLYYFNVKEKNAEFLVIQYCVYAVLIVAGYFWHHYLGKKLEKLYEEKIEYIDLLDLLNK